MSKIKATIKLHPDFDIENPIGFLMQISEMPDQAGIYKVAVHDQEEQEIICLQHTSPVILSDKVINFVKETGLLQQASIEKGGRIGRKIYKDLKMKY